MAATYIQKTIFTIAIAAFAAFAAFLWFSTKKNPPKALPEIIKNPSETAQKITLFYRPNCIYCLKAKKFLDERSLTYQEVNLSENEKAYKQLGKLMKRVTVPQIFIGDHHVGGHSDLINLSEEQLRSLLYP